MYPILAATQHIFSLALDSFPQWCAIRPLRKPSLQASLPGAVLALASSFTLISGAPAWAGGWRVDHYEYDIDCTGTQFYRDGQTGQSKSASMYPEGGHFKGIHPSDSPIWDVDCFAGLMEYSGSDVAHGAGSGSATMSVTAFYHWSPAFEGEPPTKYLYTSELVTGYLGLEYHGNPQYTETSPYRGQGFTVEALDDGFDGCFLPRTNPADPRERKYLGSVNPFAGGYGSGPHLEASGTHYNTYFKIVPSEGKTIVKVTRTLQAKVSSAGFTLSGEQYVSAWCALKYRAGIAIPGVLVRRKGTTGPFGGGTTITAGHGASDEHKAEVGIQVGIAGVPRSDLPPLDIRSLNKDTNEAILSRKGVFQDATVSNTEEDVTDSTGFLLAKIVTSKDKITTSGPGIPEEDGPVIAELDLGPGYPKPRAYIDHSWASVEWKMGVDGERDYVSHFVIPDEGGGSEWIWTEVTSTATGQPLPGHNLKFSARRLLVRVEDPQTERIITKLFTVDEAEATQETQEHEDDPDYQVIYKRDIDADVADFIDLPAATESAPGIYKGRLTVKTAPNFSVENYTLQLKDLRVFRKD